ncbi:MAG: type II secretion system protein [Candidatus Abyssobacteria bacterium SURF_5]|jgi:prepilin-type N-terminal cleavage/methylation domain-containing protein|uniref:Type II secretion system protein n=1 Tax=Abyssobacteria bacterium (strain SURF_5) TaxID=2093360 RepID=A0A3A4NUJ8_ABYX5|nr:MAG: type II secretion system protein [Candidatus Abyssubacteria bacterium SURF_5]
MNCRGGNRRNAVNSVTGFTLLELLAVIAIIGILAGLALPAISRVRERSKIGAAKAQLAHIETAISQFYADHGTFPAMGNDWLDGTFYPSEDIGTDRIGPFMWDNTLKDWVVNPAYQGPDRDGSEGNYQLDPGEDIGLDLVANDPYDSSPNIPSYFSDNDGSTTDPSIGENNGKLDGSYYDRLGMFTKEDTSGLFDIFGPRGLQYHYYAAQVTGQTMHGMPEFTAYTGLADYKTNHPTHYNRWVIYSVGPDGIDHGLHNYFLTMQSGEDVGSDGYASDPSDADTDFILFEPSANENNETDDALSGTPVTFRETQWTISFAGGSYERGLNPAGTSELDTADGQPVFSYDVRQERRSQRHIYATPDGDAAAFGVIMRYGP